MASRKVQTALAMRDAIGQFADAVERINELDEVFVDSGYDAGGSDPIVDSDVAAHDITAQDLANFSTFRDQLDLFLNSGEPLQVDYWAKIRAFQSPGD